MKGGEGSDFYLIGDSAVFTCEGVITANGGNDIIAGGSGDDAVMIGDHNPVCGVPSGGAGNDRLTGNDGADAMHGDSYTDSGDPWWTAATARTFVTGAAASTLRPRASPQSGFPSRTLRAAHKVARASVPARPVRVGSAWMQSRGCIAASPRPPLVGAQPALYQATRSCIPGGPRLRWHRRSLLPESG